MKFLLFDENEKYVSNLKNVINAKHKEEINGEDTLELSLIIEKELTESEKARKIDKLYNLPEGTMESAGRNLVTKEKINSMYRLNNTGTLNTTHVDCPNGFYSANQKDETAVFRMDNAIDSNGYWTVSFDIRGSQATSVSQRVSIADSAEVQLTTTSDNSWKRVFATFNINGYDGENGHLDFRPTWAYLFVRNLKLEKTTPWLEEQINLEGRNLLLGTTSGGIELEQGTGWYTQFTHPEVILEVGETYTFSVIIEKVYDDAVPINVHLGTGTTTYQKDIAAWRLQNIPFGVKISLTHTITEADLGIYDGIFAWRIRNEQQPTKLKYREIKLEKGPTATPWNPALEEVILWTPAPEDVDIKPRETVEKNYRIAYKNKQGHWKEFIVKSVEEKRNTREVQKYLYCESSFYETLGDYVEDKRPSGTATNALSNALISTRWEVGIVDNLGNKSTNFYRISAKEAVQKVAKVWEAEVQTRVKITGNKITNRYVDLLKRCGGDYGQRFTYRKNLEEVSRMVNEKDVITALYGYGKGEEVGDGYGRRIDFAEINNGKAYVENLDALERWGRNDSNGTKAHVFGKIEFDDIENKEILLQETLNKLEEESQPLITYFGGVVDLGDSELGDYVVITDNEFNPPLKVKARVVSIVRDLLNEQNNQLTLGNYIPSIVDGINEQEEYIDNFRGKQAIWDRSDVINQDGTIDAQFLNDLVNELNTRMNSQGGYVFISDDGQGLITTDKPTIEESTMAIQLLGGAFRIANSKLSNGEFNWKTFGDGNGFIADEFIGGLLKGGKVSFDLTNGTLLIGENVENYKLYFDGTRLRINGEVSSSSVIVGDETLEETLINLGREIEQIQGGGGNLLLNTNFGTYKSPSDYWWSANGLTWQLYEARIDNWQQHEALINNWDDFEKYNW